MGPLFDYRDVVIEMSIRFLYSSTRQNLNFSEAYSSSTQHLYVMTLIAVIYLFLSSGKNVSIWVEMNSEYLGSSLLLTRQDRQRLRAYEVPVPAAYKY